MMRPELLPEVRKSIAGFFDTFLLNEFDEEQVGEPETVAATFEAGTLRVKLKSTLGEHELELPVTSDLFFRGELDLEVVQRLAAAAEALFKKLDRTQRKARKAAGYKHPTSRWSIVRVSPTEAVTRKHIMQSAQAYLESLGARPLAKKSARGVTLALFEESPLTLGVLRTDGEFDDGLAAHLHQTLGVGASWFSKLDGGGFISEARTYGAGAHPPAAPDWRLPRPAVERLHFTHPTAAPRLVPGREKLSATLLTETGEKLPWTVWKTARLINPLEMALQEVSGHRALTRERLASYEVGLLLRGKDGAAAWGKIVVQNGVSVAVEPLSDVAWRETSFASIYCPDQSHPLFAKRVSKANQGFKAWTVEKAASVEARNAELTKQAEREAAARQPPTESALAEARDGHDVSKMAALLMRQLDTGDRERLQVLARDLFTAWKDRLDEVTQSLDRVMFALTSSTLTSEAWGALADRFETGVLRNTANAATCFRYQRERMPTNSPDATPPPARKVRRKTRPHGG